MLWGLHKPYHITKQVKYESKVFLIVNIYIYKEWMISMYTFINNIYVCMYGPINIPIVPRVDISSPRNINIAPVQYLFVE